MQRILKFLTWPAALFIAGTLLWYEQYKLTANPGSVWLFTTLTDWLFLDGHEKAMRLAVASMEILASILVVIPFTRVIGAALALGILSGAIFFHVVSPLGIDPYNDGARLFTEACEIWLLSAFILLVERAEAVTLLRRITPAGWLPG